MQRSAMLAAAVLALLATAALGYQSCHKHNPKAKTHVVSPLPHTYIKPDAIPANWDWRNVNNTNYVTLSRNQHIPQYCGSCWAFGTTSAMSDRIKILRRAQWPDVVVSPQVVVYCVPDGCDGGDATSAYEFIKENGVPQDSCQNYVARGTGQECTPIHTCENCGDTCTPVTNYTNLQLREHGQVAGVQEIMAEIFARGPVACGIEATSELEAFHGTGIFYGQPGQDNINHIISVAGFGEMNGEPYWIVRNSWGTYWGDQGWFKLSRRTDRDLGVSSDCDWAVPENPGI